jgi:hypothetical protein
MRQDILDIVKNRPSWILTNDKEYQELLQAIEYAQKHKITHAETELRELLDKRRTALLDHL